MRQSLRRPRRGYHLQARFCRFIYRVDALKYPAEVVILTPSWGFPPSFSYSLWGLVLECFMRLDWQLPSVTEILSHFSLSRKFTTQHQQASLQVFGVSSLRVAPASLCHFTGWHRPFLYPHAATAQRSLTSTSSESTLWTQSATDRVKK